MTRLMSTLSCGFAALNWLTKSMNACGPSAANGLCWMYVAPTYFATAFAGFPRLKASV
jgi:hypothetical protein